MFNISRNLTLNLSVETMQVCPRFKCEKCPPNYKQSTDFILLLWCLESSHAFQQITLTNESNDIPKVFKGFVSLIQHRIPRSIVRLQYYE